MPGVSGAMLAINFGVYEKLLSAITNFFDNLRSNFIFLLKVGFGGLLAIMLGSNGILYLFTNYKFLTMLFFIGLMLGGTYRFSKKIYYQRKHIIILLVIIGLFLYLSLGNINNLGVLPNNEIKYFLGGFTEIFASIVPGISGTSLLMILGIYEDIIELIANVYNFNYILDNINIYFSYSIGMIISFIINCYLVNYLIKKHKNNSYVLVLGLSLASIIYLLIMTFKLKFVLFELLIGIVLFVLGIIIANLLAK